MGSLVNRRRYSSGGKKDERLLPYGYFELKYIENTSDAYIDTGVNGALSNSYEIKFSVTDLTAGQFIFGDWYPANTSQLIFDYNANIIRYYVGDVDMCRMQPDMLPHIMTYNGTTKTGSFDGDISTGNVAQNTSGEVQYLFATHRYDGTIRGYGKCRVYYCKIESNGVLIRNFIPCLSPDNEVGMYDTVTKTFFKSPNGTAFVAGPKVYDGDDRNAPYDYEVEYLESTGTQYIDTGISVVSPFDLDIDLTYLGRSTTSTGSPWGRVLGARYIDERFALFIDNTDHSRHMLAVNYGNTDTGTLRPHTSFQINALTNLKIISTSNNEFSIYKDNILDDTYTYNSVNSNVHIFLFGIWDNGSFSGGTSLRIHRITLTNGNNQVFDAIPVVKDGVGCMYDKVSGTFFYNQGTGDFIVGPRVIHCTDNDYYGIRWLATDAPDSPIIRIGNMNWHRTLPIHSKMRRCILGDDGSKRYVSNSDYTKDTDGNAIDYTVSSANGVTYDTVVEMPEHCFLTGTETIDDVDYHYIKLFPKLMIGNFVPTHYMGAFEAMLDRDNNKLYSTVKANIVYNNDGEVDGADLTYAENWRGGNNSSSYDSDSAKTLMGRAATSLSIINFCTNANHRGSYYGITNWAARNNLCRLYAVEYANFDSQATFNPELNAYGYHQGGLGFGVCSTADAWIAYNNGNPIMPCGITLKLGSKTGIVRYNLGATYSSGATAVTYFDVPSYRGVENPFAHLLEDVIGMYIYGADSVNNIYVAEDGFHARTSPSNKDNTAPSGYKLRSSSLPLSNGWPVTLDWNDDGDFLAKTLDTTSANTADNKSILRDYFWGQSAIAKMLMVGGRLNYSVRSGLFMVQANIPIGAINEAIGARLLKVPYYNV